MKLNFKIDYEVYLGKVAYLTGQNKTRMFADSLFIMSHSEDHSYESKFGGQSGVPKLFPPKAFYS